VPGMIANIFNFKPATTGAAELVNGISKINDGLVTAEQHSKYFATNFAKAASESLKTGQSLNTKAMETASEKSIILSNSFKQYMADTGKVYNLQGLIE
jgi:ABC-type Zn uptake system ZnuABC Zn-binding protein ZnuA